MSLLQIFDKLSSDFAMMAGSGTLGSIATMLVQKLLNRNSDKTDIVTNQVKMLNDVNAKLNEVVEQLQEVACYRKNCNERQNGEHIKKNDK